MRLETHFIQNARSDVKQGTAAILDSILSDDEALAEFDYEGCLAFDYARLGALLRNLQAIKRTNPINAEILRAGLHMTLGQMIEDNWIGDLESWIRSQYEEVDLAALAAEESIPEPSDEARGALISRMEVAHG